MISRGKTLRQSVLGGLAAGVVAGLVPTSAQADELSALKAQLETLQGRVNQLEAAPSATAAPNPPGRASLITFRRGQGSLGDWNVDRSSEGQMPAEAGFTIAITPTADVPAPVTEISISGYVKGDVIYDFDQDSLGDTFTSGLSINNSEQVTSGVRLHARQSRFRIRSRTDTSIGEIRTLIEGDFFRFETNNPILRLRHAWGVWEMTPKWSLGIGRFWRISCDVNTPTALVDFGGSAGDCASSRAAQVRFTYTDGPVSWRIGAVETLQPVDRTRADGTVVAPGFPNIASSLLYTPSGGHHFFIGAEIAHIRYHGDQPENGAIGLDDETVGWEVQAGTNINLGDIAVLIAHLQYGDGITNILGAGITGHSLAGAPPKITTNRAWGGYVGLSVKLTDSLRWNTQYGRANPRSSAAAFRSTSTLHTNLLWQPVSQMRLGWEFMYGRKRTTTATSQLPGRKLNEDVYRAQFGAWFFF